MQFNLKNTFIKVHQNTSPNLNLCSNAMTKRTDGLNNKNTKISCWLKHESKIMLQWTKKLLLKFTKTLKKYTSVKFTTFFEIAQPDPYVDQRAFKVFFLYASIYPGCTTVVM